METSITAQQVEDMLQRAYNKNREALNEYGAYTWRQWLNTFGANEVAIVIESDFTLYDLYLKDLPEGMYLSDILEAYQKGELKRPPQGQFLVDQRQMQPTGFNPQVPWQAQPQKSISPDQAVDLYQTASQKAVGVNKERVLKARKELYFAFHSDPEFAEKVGVSKTEINKRIRSYSGLSVKDRELEDNLNQNVPPEHQWVGITNSTFLGKQKIDPNTLEQFVREIDVSDEAGHYYFGDRGESLRRYVANTFLAIDMHIQYKDLGFKIGKFDKRTTNGKFFPREKTIVISNLQQETVAHEIGHYLDWKWAEELGSNEPLSRILHHGLLGSNIPEEQKQWAYKYRDFVKSLMLKSDIDSEYSQEHYEVFARFVDRFVAWTSRGINLNRETHYNDRFIEQDFKNFVRLLQEKSYVDATHPISKTASLTKQAEKLKRYEVLNLPDTDRYISDDYAINLALQETVHRFSIGIYLTNYKVGVSGYQEYWHFDKDNKSEAERTYNRILNILKEIVTEIKENEVPNVLIKPFIRNRLDNIAPEFKERTGVYNFNYYTTDVAKEDDWRSTIYGFRYPKQIIEQIRLNWHPDNVSSKIEITDGNSSRNMTYRYKYEQDGSKEKDKMYSQSTVNKADIQKHSGILLPSEYITIRIANDDLKKYDRQDVPIDLFEIKTENGWLPLTYFAKAKTANKNKLPWALVGLMGLGLPASYELGRKNPHSQPNPIVEQYEAESPVETIESLPVETDAVDEVTEQKPEQEQQSRGIRNNNPGNIEYNNTTWNGMAPKQTDGRFAVFEHPQDGIRAMARILRNYQSRYHTNSVKAIISKWAPPGENNTNAYVNHIANAMGVNPNDKIDLSNDQTLHDLISAMIRHENGSQPYDQKTIMQGIQAERGNNRPWVETNDMPMKDQVKSIPSVLNQPKFRSKNPPEPVIRPFDTKQVEVFDKMAARFHYAFEQIDKIKAKQLLYRAVAEVGTNWKDIAHVLIHEYNVPRELMSYLNSEFLRSMSKMAGKTRWTRRINA